MSKLEDGLIKVDSQNNEIVKQLLSDRVFNVEYVENENQIDGVERLYITEGCDDYFSMELTKDRCLALSKYFKELSDIL